MLPFRLNICGIGELGEYCGAGVSHVLSILDPQTPEPEAFARFAPHRRTRLEFHDVVLPLDGRVRPARADVERILAFGRECAEHGARHVLIHCFAGVSRSTAAAAILMAASNPGREEETFGALAAIRPRAWPNSQMIRLADAVLERNGALSAALRRYYDHVARNNTELADYIRSIEHRGHEVPDVR